MERTFEQGFASAERGAENATKSAVKLANQAKAMQKAAKLGDIAALRRAVAGMSAQLDALMDDVANAQQSWPFDEEGEAAYMESGFIAELQSAAEAAGLLLFERDGQLVASPSTVRISPGDRSVRVDKKRLASVRPTTLVDMLKANQQKPGGNTRQFTETLWDAYELLAEGKPQGIPLVQVYRALALGRAKEYSPTDFGRDIYLLDSSGLQTKKGWRVSFPTATGTKGGKAFQFITRDGVTREYYSLRFEKE